MAVTLFGKELKKICIDHDINRAKLAKSIGMKPADLASVEHGRIEMPRAALKRLRAAYVGDILTEATINGAIRNSVNKVVFDLKSMSDGHRYSVFALKEAIEADIEINLANAMKVARDGRKERADAKAKKEAEVNDQELLSIAEVEKKEAEERSQMSDVELDEYETAKAELEEAA